MANTISVRFGASVMTRCGPAAPRAKTRTAAQRPRFANDRSAGALRLTALLLVEIVRDAEAGAGGAVHLLRGIDRVLQLGNAILDLRKLLFDLILQIADLLLRHLQSRLVELALLIRDHCHLKALPSGLDRS